MQCLLKSLRHNRLKSSQTEPISQLSNVPTVSLCIPARNETHALEDCLISAIASNYLKLEILVLDDCSQDKTSQIIRNFAHDGVRFVQGDQPASGWLGKNSAYETLARSSSGDYLVFMSVDTRLEIGTLSSLIAYMHGFKLSMVSVLPRRIDSWRSSIIFSPLRYFWQLVLPPSFNTPTATSLWVIRRDELESLGGFNAIKGKINSENALANRLFTDKKYRFLIADNYLKLWYAKKWSSQVETSIRLWYPQLRMNTLYSILALLGHGLFFVLPVVGLAVGLFNWSLPVVLASLGAIILQSLLYFFYAQSVYTKIHAVIGAVLLPVIALQEMALIALSVYKYKLGRVNWKGRNICYPIYYRPNKL